MQVNKVNPDTGLKFTRVTYFKGRCLSLMGCIETLTNKMFHEINPALEKEMWAAYDANCSYSLMKVYRELCEFHDYITMD